MLSGQRVVDKNRPSGRHSLVEWAKPYLAHKRKIFRVIDNRLEGQYTLEVAHTVANIALRCLSVDPRLRPSMAEVVKVLEQLQDPKGARPRRHSSHGTRPRRTTSGDNAATNDAGPTAYPRPQAALGSKWNENIGKNRLIGPNDCIVIVKRLYILTQIVFKFDPNLRSKLGKLSCSYFLVDWMLLLQFWSKRQKP